MKTIRIAALTMTALLMAIGPALAGQVNLPNVFTPDTPARADSVNENFSALAVEVNDNDARIGAIDARIDALEEYVHFGVRRDDVFVKTITAWEPVDFSTNSTVWANAGSAFSKTDGVFTAPADGIYSFDGAVNFTALTAGDLIYVQILAAGRYFLGDRITATSTTHTLNASTTVFMTAGQTARLYAYAPAGTQYYGNSATAYQWTWFAGAKVK